MAHLTAEPDHLVIDINLRNADFHWDDELDISAVKAIFDEILLEFESSSIIDMRLRDRNGNSVGRAVGGWEPEEEEEEEEEEE
jgi:hypothetical protein